jgi:arsenate reductase
MRDCGTQSGLWLRCPIYIDQLALAIGMKNILVLCTGNSCRSQMAHGYLQKFASNETKVYSAGVETHGLNPGAVATMAEDGIDISSHTSNHVDEYSDINFDLILTVCDHAKERCPVLPSSAKKVHFNFPDPSKFEGTEEEKKDEFRRVRNLIKQFCRDLLEQNP